MTTGEPPNTQGEEWWRRGDHSASPEVRAAIEQFIQLRPESIGVIIENLLQMVKQGEVNPESLPLPIWILMLTHDEFETLSNFNSEEGFNPQTQIVPAQLEPREDSEEIEEEEGDDAEDSGINDNDPDDYDERGCTCSYSVYGLIHDQYCPVHGYDGY